MESPAEADGDEEGVRCIVWLLVVAAAAAAAAAADAAAATGRAADGAESGSGRWDRGLGAVALTKYEI